MNLPVNLQEVLPALQYIQPHPSQVCNCDDMELIWIEPSGIFYAPISSS